jgi:pyrimidine-nucleoside phosphorylase
MYNSIDIITKKREGKNLDENEIKYIIEEYMRSNLKDYQMSAFLMASFINGLNKKETRSLTKAMYSSGDGYDFSDIEGEKVDKHSTGGVGDKVSFVLSPLLAVLGYINPMMAGRGLGFTGGTIDKLESLEGYNPEMSSDKIKTILDKEGAVIFSQSEKIAPADKKLYSLRDVTGTVESIPLITASIVSKKMAEDISCIVYDIKCGNGAFMKHLEEAEKLAEWLVDVTEAVGIKAKAVISDMNQVLGYFAGNALELYEVFNFLNGSMEVQDLKKISIQLAYELVSEYETIEEKKFIKKCEDLIYKGKVYDKFYHILRESNVKKESIDKIEKGEFINKVFEIRSKQEGRIIEMNTRNMGKIVHMLGGGRSKLNENINHNVGLKICKKLNEEVAIGDVLAKIYYEDEFNKKRAIDLLNSSIKIGEKYEKKTFIYKVI